MCLPKFICRLFDHLPQILLQGDVHGLELLLHLFQGEAGKMMNIGHISDLASDGRSLDIRGQKAPCEESQNVQTRDDIRMISR